MPPKFKKGLSKPQGEPREHGHHHHGKRRRLDQQPSAFQKGERVARQHWDHRHRPHHKEELPPGQEQIGEAKQERWRYGSRKRWNQRRHMHDQPQSTFPPPQPNQSDLIKKRRQHHKRFAKFDFQILHPFGFQHSFMSNRINMRPHRHLQVPLAAYKVDSAGGNFPKDPGDKVAGSANIIQQFQIDDLRDNYSQKSNVDASQMGSIPDFVDALRNCSFLYQNNINSDELQEKVKSSAGFMFYLVTQEYQYFRKFIHEKVINLINTGTFSHPTHQNPYIIMNTSLKNSATLKTIMQAYFINNQTQTQKQERIKDLNQTIESRQGQTAQIDYYKIKEDFVDQEFEEQLMNGSNIRYKDFDRNLQEKVAWLAQQCVHLFQQEKSKSKDPYSVDLFTTTISHILYGNIVPLHINELAHLAQSNLDKKDHIIKESFSDIAYKIFLICSLKQCLKLCFKKQKPTSKQLSFESKQTRKAMYYSAIIASYAKIPQFQEISFDRQQKEVDFCASNSVPFFDNDYYSDNEDAVNPSLEIMQQNGFIQANFYCHYFIQLMNFLKSTVTQGITIKLTKNNLMVSNSRMKFAIQQPFCIVKTHKDIEKINPELSNVIKIIQQKQTHNQVLNISINTEQRQKKISQHIEAHLNNLKFAYRVFQLILQQLQYKEYTQISKEFEINSNHQQHNIEKIRMEYDDLLQAFKKIQDLPKYNYQEEKSFLQIKMEQSLKVDNDQKDVFKLMEAILIMKINIITYKFYQLIDKNITYRKFLSINYQITSSKGVLPTIYCNLFSQNFYLQYLAEEDDFLEQISAKTWEQQYNNNLMNLLDKLYLIYQTGSTGIHGVKQFKIKQFAFASQFTAEYIDEQKTVLFSGLPRIIAMELLAKVCMPVKDQNLREKKKNFVLNKQQEQNKSDQEEQRRQFTTIEAQRTIKNLLARIKHSFNNATQNDIRVPLFLLRHFMIDNRITRQNFPNPIPRLNILQAFMDTNIRTNLFNPNFVEEYYLNRAITKFTSKLSTKSHNQFVQAIFLLSLATEKTELQYLKSVRSFLKEKTERQSTVKPVNITQFYSKMTISSKKQVFWHIQQLSSKTMITLLRDTIKNFPSYFNQEGVNIPLDEEQIKQYNRLLAKRTQLLYHISPSNLPIPFLCKQYQLFQVDHNNTHQLQKAELIRELLLLQFKNMNYLFRTRNDPSTLIKNIVSLMPYYAQGKMVSYEVIIQTQPLFLQPKRKNDGRYFNDQTIENLIIQRRSDFYYNLTQAQRKIFINNLLKIIIQANSANINLLNIDIATITFVPNQEITPPHEYLLYQQLEKTSFRPHHTARVDVKPIFDQISVCRVYHPQLAEYNSRVYSQYGQYDRRSRDLAFKHHLNVFTFPDYFQRLRQQSQTRLFDENAEDIGNVGLIICSLIFNLRNYYSQHQVNRCNFLRRYNQLQNNLSKEDIQEDIIIQSLSNEQRQYSNIQMMSKQDIADILADFINEVIIRQPNTIAPLTYNNQSFLPFLAKLIHPRYEQRATIIDIQQYLQGDLLRP